MIRSYFFRAVIVLSVAASLAGCAHTSGSAKKEEACANNQYLAKYNCSVREIEAAAQSGSADAQYGLGYMYYYGIDTVKDQQTAVLWIERAAAQGQPLAKKALGLIKSDAEFGDLHKAAQEKPSKTSEQSSIIRQQESEDVSTLNTKKAAEPITNHLPAYQQTSQTKKSIRDPRLSANAKPVVASAVRETSAPASVPQVSQARYTLQLIGTYDLAYLKHVMASLDLGSHAQYFQTKNNGKDWYFLTYGHYETAAAAHDAIKQLPKNVQDMHPWVKTVASVQKEVKSQEIVA
ncbi:MAG: hypothetical protein A3I77_01315 [Gammaproteobacteria bacterium RIFCSPLOWO2_02_FULL_42_14]|nr:MAG: hypothetical protein A3B71_07500 [Gammaproteobacteria bacterium RIFCSPHIGHO2_02_FULL_42_43]OGT27466.1 MAG: hypothetical protein A2624_03325 [Gammaproteobacteria bacterium RIFCSPHIGHO2_01_FULL_42_8]OGT52268.1 MAG: hypothetical protein A3E54_01375 [Gammaproteobacteria bacterium RIFCSPHIGHO2_12_FULL_41_25]OGT61881.1 MAG: hypothetical protein A3I77_01315 [Gammaproteobacteria bacterium RIFCSPLOWO2_02_FULL_42_14]OGT86409.1 MAG: hypothetical protein A3G86_07780 [Gammaproteobacteria bacterium R